MTDAIRGFVALVVSVCIQFQPLFFDADLTTVLGKPSEETYDNGQGLARSVWDMAVQDDVLYIGAGDYSANTGPTPIWAYDINEGTWFVSATVKDEAVSRFCKGKDVLIAPGMDSTAASWEYGNYHTLSDGHWDCFEKLPGAVHNFDVIRFDGKTFFALGTADGETSPVLVSIDGTKDFQSIPFYHDGKPILNSELEYTRVYDFFVLDGALYCLLATYGTKTASRMFCRYQDGSFICVADADLSYISWKQIPVMEKVAVGNIQYFTTGKLYQTSDFLQITSIDMPDGGVVTDLYTYKTGEQEHLYALSNVRNEDGTYTATVYLMDKGFTALAAYTAEVPALSMVRHGLYFYVGLGGSAESEDTGAVVRLSVFERILSE